MLSSVALAMFGHMSLTSVLSHVTFYSAWREGGEGGEGGEGEKEEREREREKERKRDESARRDNGK